MEFFGFCDTDNDRRACDTLLARSRSVLPGEPNFSSQVEPVRSAVWGGQVVSQEGVLVALQGTPLLRRSAAAPWRRSADAAREVLRAYRETGDACLTSMDGRFALAIIDGPRRRVLLAVDPMGIGRLCYSIDGHRIVFGESAYSVARLRSESPRLAHQAIFDYLMFHMVPAPATIFSGVRKLRAGHVVVLENGKAREARYWTQQFEESNSADYESLRDELHASLRTAVGDCAPDRTTGAFLSGGLDSSTVAGLLQEVGPKPAKTFSIGFGYADYDELSYARIANAHFGCQGHEYVVTGKDIAAGFPLIARHYDEPFGNSSALPVYFCAKLAREAGVSQLLAGDGGDELYAGNARYAEQHVFERYQLIPGFLREKLLEPLLARWPETLSPGLVRKGRGYVRKAKVPLPLRLESWNLVHQLGAEQILDPDFRKHVSESATFAGMRTLWDSAPANTALNRMLYYDWQVTLADNDLRKVETMSALAGISVAYPMLHPGVVANSMRVPPRLKMPGTQLRRFYKRAMTGFLPDAIIHKRKHGFGLPFGLWLQESRELRDQIESGLLAFRKRGIVGSQFIDELVQRHRQEDAKYYGGFIWVLAMLECWLQEHRLSV